MPYQTYDNSEKSAYSYHFSGIIVKFTVQFEFIMRADVAAETGIHADDVRSTLKSLGAVTSPVTRYSLSAFF